jgi:hypothetical protein
MKHEVSLLCSQEPATGLNPAHTLGILQTELVLPKFL